MDTVHAQTKQAPLSTTLLPSHNFALILLLGMTGGSATSQWLEDNFSDYIGEHWTDGQNPQRDINKTFLQVSKPGASCWPTFLVSLCLYTMRQISPDS